MTLFAVGADPGWALFAWSALELDERGRPRVLGNGSIDRDGRADSDWLDCANMVPQRAMSYTLLRTLAGAGHQHIVCAVEDMRGPINGAQRKGETNDGTRNCLLMQGALVSAMAGGGAAPVTLVTPQQWRAALGLPKGAEKSDAHAMLARLCRCTVKELGSNEHKRDAACIAYAAATMARRDLMIQQAKGRAV